MAIGGWSTDGGRPEVLTRTGSPCAHEETSLSGSDRKAAIRRRLGMAFRVASVGACVVALWWFLRGLDLRALGETFRRALLWPLVLALLFNLASQFLRTLVWLIMLRPGH